MCSWFFYDSDSDSETEASDSGSHVEQEPEPEPQPELPPETHDKKRTWGCALVVVACVLIKKFIR
jgi:hypothetical protein